MSPLAASVSKAPIAALPHGRGRLLADAPIGRHTWFGVGGAAEMLFEPADIDDLAGFLGALPQTVPITVIGGAANVLVRDGGIPGVTIRLGRGFQHVVAEDQEIIAGAAGLHLNVSRLAAEKGIAGLEFLSGIPGTIGGGLRMNAGAYGRAVENLLVSATAVDRGGREHVVGAKTMGFSYRRCNVDQSWIFVAARLRGCADDPKAIAQKMAEIRATREATQPIRARTGGSTFKNTASAPAWRLIDAAGCRGLRRGGAMVSPKHANFLINTGSATAADLEGLGEEVRRRVCQNSGVVLEWEICRVGRPAAGFEPMEESVSLP